MIIASFIHLNVKNNRDVDAKSRKPCRISKQ